MTQTARALQSFFGSFGIPAYVEYSLPDDAKMPYITYELAEPDWRGSHAEHARVWYNSNSFSEIASKIDEIKAAIGNGVSIPTENGAIYLYADDDFCQFQPMDEPKIKCAYLSFVLQCYTN